MSAFRDAPFDVHVFVDALGLVKAKHFVIRAEACHDRFHAMPEWVVRLPKRPRAPFEPKVLPERAEFFLRNLRALAILV